MTSRRVPRCVPRCVVSIVLAVGALLVPSNRAGASSRPVVRHPVIGVGTSRLQGAAGSATPSSDPVGYLRSALDAIERNALARGSVDWPTIRARAEAKGVSAASIEETYPAIREALAGLNDPHASFRPPAKATEITQGQANGYGFLAAWPTRVVVSISDGGPAATAGMKLGDFIVSIESKAPTGRNGVVAIPTKTARVDQLRVVVSRTTAGPVRSGKPTTVKKRYALVIRKGAFSLVTTPAQDPAVVRTVGERVGYLELPGILGTVEVQQTYADASQAAITATLATPRCGWVIDVRRNRGGWVYPALAAAAPLVPLGPDGVLMGKFDASGVTEQWMWRDGSVVVRRPGAQPPEYPVFTVNSPARLSSVTPVAVLQSALTASAGEALVLTLQGRELTRTFGEATLGLTTFDAVLPLSDGALILVSNAAMTNSAGTPHVGPVLPDVAVTPDWNHVGDSADPVLRAALNWLADQPTCRSAA